MKMTPEATVTITARCEECKGTGVISNPIWDQFNAEVKQGNTSESKMEEWFRERGEATQRTRMGQTYWQPPPEEITCGECEGTKTVTRQVTLRELAAYLDEILHPERTGGSPKAGDIPIK